MLIFVTAQHKYTFPLCTGTHLDNLGTTTPTQTVNTGVIIIRRGLGFGEIQVWSSFLIVETNHQPMKPM